MFSCPVYPVEQRRKPGKGLLNGLGTGIIAAKYEIYYLLNSLTNAEPGL
jgi:hypothetical protein